MDMFAKLPPAMQREAMESLMKLNMGDAAEATRLKKFTGVDYLTYGKRRTNAEIKQEHDTFLRQYRENLALNPCVVNLSHPTNTKPAAAFPVPPSLSSLTPIYASQLTPGETHRGRMLRGRLFGEAILLTGTATLMADDKGDFIKLGLYNLCATAEQVRAMLPVGRPIVIVEPFFKVFSDGSMGVRVDNPKEVIFPGNDATAPVDAAGVQAEGVAHFKALQYVEAEACFTRALGMRESATGGLLAVLFNNVSACHLALGRPGRALAAAIAAAALSGGPTWTGAQATKARARAAAAATSLWHQGPAWASDSLASRDARSRLLRAFATEVIEGDDDDIGLGSASAPPAHVDDIASSSAHKESGNARFRDGDPSQAMGHYSHALDALTPHRAAAATLLSNRAATALERGGVDGGLAAVSDARAALIIGPIPQPKAHHRLAMGLLSLGWKAESAAALDSAVAALPTTDAAELIKLRDRIAAGVAGEPKRAAAAGKRPAVAPQSEPSLPEKLRLFETDADALTDPAVLERINIMTLFAESQAKDTGRPMPLTLSGGSLIDGRVPPFHTEFASAGLLPAHSDLETCRRKLWLAYESARALPQLELCFADPTYGEGRESDGWDNAAVSKSDLLKRLHSRDHDDIKWMIDANIGEIRLRKHHPYEPGLYHSYSNVVVKADVLEPGRTHASVGFVDLAALSASLAVSGHKEEAAPLAAMTRWVGFEVSPYAIAKTSVVAAMLMMGAATDHVLQVWYSSGWSRAAHAAFRAALAAILDPASPITGGLRLPIAPAVIVFLRHWSLAEVPLAETRRRWLDSHLNTYAFIGNFKVKADRLALTAYILTGQLLHGEVGSVLMFSLPPGDGGTVALGESVLQTLPIEDLARIRNCGSPDLVSAAVELLRQRIGSLGRLLRNGAVGIELVLSAVTPDDSAVCAAIAGLKPHTISWSNIPDYCSRVDFHRMARACSAEDTVHYFHTMNFPLDVFGASCIDYAFRMGPGKELAESSKKFYDASLKIIRVAYALSGWSRLLIFPPNDNFRNILDFALYLKHYEAWATDLFAAGDFKHQTQTSIQDVPFYSLLSRCNSAFSMAFTYDEQVVLQPQTIPGFKFK